MKTQTEELGGSRKPRPTKKYQPWAVNITIFILCFIGLVITFGIRASKVPYDLVAEDYYEQGSGYQQRIDAIARSEKLEEVPSISKKRTQVVLTIPESISSKLTEGRLVLFRPSNADHDVTTPIPPNQTTLEVDMTGKPAGNWKVKVYWQMEGQDYYQESSIYFEVSSTPLNHVNT